MVSKTNLLKLAAGVVAVAVLIAAGYGIMQWNERRVALASLTSNQLKDWYASALKYEETTKERPDDFEYYNAAGFNWKSLGDATGKRYFYERALKVYERALSNEKATSALFHLNAGNILKTLGDFEAADAHYTKAIELNTGDDAMHRARIELYLAWKDKTPAQVLEVFDYALRTLLFSVNVNLEKAAYLTSLGRYEEALAIYESVKVGYPDQPNLNQKIEGLKLLIADQKK